MSVGQNKTYLLKGVSEIPNIVRMINEGSPELPPIDDSKFAIRSIKSLPDGRDKMFIVPTNSIGMVIKGSGAEFIYQRVDLSQFNNTTLTGSKEKPIKDSPIVNLESKYYLENSDLVWLTDRLGIPSSHVEAKIIATYPDFIYEIKLEAKPYIARTFDGGSYVHKKAATFFIWDKNARRTGIHVQPVTEEMLSGYDGAFYIAPPVTNDKYDFDTISEFRIELPDLTIDYEIPTSEYAELEITYPKLKVDYEIENGTELTMEGPMPTFPPPNTGVLFDEPFPHPVTNNNETD